MSAEQASVEPLIVRAARSYRRAGLFPIPVAPGGKNPTLDRWQTIDDFDLDAHFRRPSMNIGLRMGPQPNGANLYAIDIDPKNGGDDDWAALTDGRDLPDTAWHGTPSGGRHIFYVAPNDLMVTNRRLARGIDTRGPGGQVVAPPSQIGGRSYTADAPVHKVAWAPMPLFIVDLLRPTIAESIVRHPSAGHDGGDSSMDWVREHLTWEPYLLKHGWRIERRKASELYVVRPAKTDQGHSGVAHEEGALVLFTTEIPAELRPFMRPTRDGSGEAISLFAFIAAYEFGGDLSACGRFVRERYMGGVDPGLRAHPRVDSEGARGLGVAAVGDTVPTLNLPAAFWTQRPLLAHVFQAARAQMVSPDALLVSVLPRISALIPPCYKLPAVIGSLMGLDFMGCVVAETSGGKGLATGVARRLVPGPEGNYDDDRHQVMMDVPVGSGEGLAQMFMVPERDKEGKTTGKQVVGKQALHFTVDETMALIAQGGREGATILSTMCSAWSGEALGQANARKETRRIIPPGRVRVAACLNMQVSNAWRLFEPAVAGLGFTGRVVFASAHDPSSAEDFDEHFEWPGQLSLPQWNGYSLHAIEFTYETNIRREIRMTRQGVLDGSSTIDFLRSQYLLARCKLAAIMAMTEDRRHVSDDDWRLSGEILAMSSSVLDHLQLARAQAQHDYRHTLGETRSEIEEVAAAATDRRAMARVAAWILIKLADGPKTVGALNRRLASRDRGVLEAAIDRLADDGLVVMDDVDTVRRI